MTETIEIETTPTTELPVGFAAVDEGLEVWTDEEVLLCLFKFFDRIKVKTQFIRDDNDFMTHEVLAIQAGDKFITSAPLQLDWPVEYLRIPADIKEKLN